MFSTFSDELRISGKEKQSSQRRNVNPIIFTYKLMYQNFDLRYFMKRSNCWLATITFFPIDMLACSQKKRTENKRKLIHENSFVCKIV